MKFQHIVFALILSIIVPCSLFSQTTTQSEGFKPDNLPGSSTDHKLNKTLAPMLTRFEISLIPDQTQNKSFTITVTAKYGSNTYTYFNSRKVTISDLTGSISPTTSGNFVSGVWTGNVTISQIKENNIITVYGFDTSNIIGAYGYSNEFDVLYAPSAGEIVINELMWTGSTSSYADEWIELRNTTDYKINLSGWQLTRLSSGSETLMLEIPSGTIPANGFFLISNYDESGSQIAVTPDLVDASVSLSTNQLQIKLYDGQWDGSGNLIDTADDGVGVAAAGDNTNKYSMMRKDPAGDGTVADNWFTADIALGWDNGATEKGTPGESNYLFDFGDAPDPLDQTAGQYPTLLANDGARHKAVTDFYLGKSIDEEVEGQQSANADGDDNDGTDDEDGVIFGELIAGNQAEIAVDVTLPQGTTDAVLQAWIDFNANGDWGDTDDHVINGETVQPGINHFQINIPVTASIGNTFARFRLGTQPPTEPTGAASDGEVEDYQVYIDEDSDGDGIGDSQEGTGDRDNDGVPDNEDYDPSGWIYDETNGNIISGGTISVNPSTGVNIIQDGSNGYYQFTVSQNGDYTLSYTPPSGYTLSSSCTAQSGALDPDPTIDPNPLAVGQGSKDGTNDQMTNWDCGDNPYYWEFHLEIGDPTVINNNIPLGPQPSAITLSAFYAEVGQDGILTYWTTETEPNNAGFNLYRSEQENGEYEKINSNLIPAEGSPTTGAEYSFLDTPEQSATYYYKLEDISLTGVSTFHGPISVVLTGMDIQQNMIPEKYFLSQNYPNPFNPETTIQFGLPQAEQVSLKIYDINGKLVRDLFTGMKDAGTHTLLWNGRDNAGQKVSSGVYFYYFKADEFSQTNKMILMK